MNQVSWYDAVEYCNALSLKEGLTPIYSGSGDYITMNMNANGYRLPTEAEWEYAARGGNSSRGYTYAGSNNIGSVGWYDDNDDNGGIYNHPIGVKQSNELGLYDMTGNVYEWCWDWFGGYSSSRNNPTGPTSSPSSGSYRVFRGGSWAVGSEYGRTSYREFREPSYREVDLGFRVVRRL